MENFRKFSQVETFPMMFRASFFTCLFFYSIIYVWGYFYRIIYVSGKFPEIFITICIGLYRPIVNPAGLLIKRSNEK
jgi:hypothetical protein